MPKDEPKFADILSVPMPDNSDGTPEMDVRDMEAETILRAWINVATYHLPRARVAEMLDTHSHRMRT